MKKFFYLAIACIVSNADDTALINTLMDTLSQTAMQRCKAGDMKACYSLGMLSAGKNANQAEYPLWRACNAKVAEACYRLGMLYEKDHPKKAYAMYRKACIEGDADACIDTADVLAKHGNKHAALEYLSQSCKMGNAEGCYDAGLFIEKFGERKDRAGAFYRRACKLGLTEACEKSSN